MVSDLLLILLLATTSSGAPPPLDCVNAITTPDIEACAMIDLNEAEAKLKTAYERALTVASQSRRAHDALVSAQAAWVEFRKKDCEAVRAMYEGGRESNIQFISRMAADASARAEALGEFSDGF
jgi:uncharacterized protein YecT (DUF1311 family)